MFAVLLQLVYHWVLEGYKIAEDSWDQPVSRQPIIMMGWLSSTEGGEPRSRDQHCLSPQAGWLDRHSPFKDVNFEAF